jgi:hypothetical protein
MAKNDAKEIYEIADRAAQWPEQAREELVESMLSIESRYFGVFITTKEDRQALKKSAGDMQHGRFAKTEEVEKVLNDFNRTS